jgi:branched-chain amino acid aminotransferase
MPISYANGKYIPTNQLTLPIKRDTIGTFRGYRIFTACRTLGDKIFHLDSHIDRLIDSAKAIHMNLPHNKNQLREIIQKTAAKNRQKSNQDILLEIMYSGGQAASNGVAPAGSAVLYIVVFELKTPPARWYKQGMSLATYPYQRQWTHVKLLNYVGGVIAHQTVVKKFEADEALFISPDERQIILEGTTFNFFIVRNGAVITHPLDGKILAGITRKVTLDLARQQLIDIKEDYFSYNDLKSADQAFITSSTRNIVPVTRIDNLKIGNGKPGEITKKLGEIFDEYQRNY